MSIMIRAAANTLRDVITQRLETDPNLADRFNSGLGGMMRVMLRTPREMADDSVDGLSVFLYHIEVDDQTRNAPPRRVANNRVRPPPLPLRLHFLFTPVVQGGDAESSADTEQEIMGKVIETWHTHPHLSGPDLVTDLAGSGICFTVRIEPLSLESILRIWDSLESSFQLCISYELTIADILPDLDDRAVAPVESTLAEVGVIAGGAA